MSGKDEGDEDKGFLARWSQRKREANQPEREAPLADADVPPKPVAEGDAAQPFDLSSLPKLEDVTEATDITGFLRKGVPEHLRNAALRKSWALDPAIRNYVNPALEYAYDWNTPGGVPGTQALRPGNETISRVGEPSNLARGACMETEQAGTSRESNSVAPQQAVRRHGSAKPLD